MTTEPTVDSESGPASPHESILAAADRIIAGGASAPASAKDPVNLPMIRHWTEAMGDRNPVYTDAAAARESVHGEVVAPPAMAQVWGMAGLNGRAEGDTDPFSAMTRVLDAAGYTGVVATNCAQTYHRYLRLGEEPAATDRVESVVGPKRTALGEGYFITRKTVWHCAGEPVAEMMFRILKYAPAGSDGTSNGSGAADTAGRAGERGDGAQEPDGVAAKNPPAPVVSPDTAFFWEGVRAWELRVQRCGDCHALRHPPGPMCPRCHSTAREHIVASGCGEVYSYVVHHHPPMPGRQVPYVVALVALPEGVRMTGELLGVDPDAVAIGMPVEVEFERLGEDLVLPAWRPAQGPAGQREEETS